MGMLKNPILKAAILGGAGLAGSELVRAGLQFLGIGAPPAPPAPPAPNVGAVRLNVDPQQLEQGTAAVARGAMSYFLGPFAQVFEPRRPARAASPAPAPAPAAEPEPCCDECAAGRPCKGGACAAGVAGEEDEEDEDLAGIEVDVTDLGVARGVARLVQRQQSQVHAQNIRDKQALEQDLAEARQKIEELEDFYRSELDRARKAGDSRAKELEKKLAETKKMKFNLPAMPPAARYGIAKTPSDGLYSLVEKLFEKLVPAAPAAPAAQPPVVIMPQAPAQQAAAPQAPAQQQPPWGAPPPYAAPYPYAAPDPYAALNPFAQAPDWSQVYASPMADPLAAVDQWAALATSGAPAWTAPLPAAPAAPPRPAPTSCGC